jgi:long-chain acyl-CoA synthetase
MAGGSIMQYPWRNSYDPWFPHHLKYPECSMYDLLQQSAEKHFSSKIVTYFRAIYTYADLMAEIDRTARALRADGFKAKDVATICLPNIPQTVILFYAVNKLGGICNMLHPLSPAKEIMKRMKTTNSDVLFILDAQAKKFGDDLLSCSPRRIVPCSIATYMDKPSAFFFRLATRKIGRVPANEPYLSYPGLLEKAAHQGFLNPAVKNARDAAVYLHSGGTTGEPKTIVLSDYNFNALAVQAPGILAEHEGDTDLIRHSHIAILPLFHGFGLGVGIHMMLTNAIAITLVPKFSPDSLAKILTRQKPTVLAGVPTLFEGMIRSKKLKKADLSFLRHVFSGGDTLTPEAKKRFEDFVQKRGAKLQIREGYGLTETVTVNAVNPYLNNKEGRVGLPLSDMHVKIVGLETNKALPAGEDGEICVTGPTVMLGYLNDIDATKTALKRHDDGLTWVHTGDLGALDEDGYIIFRQRLKRIIKVSGVPVFPSQIENVVMTVPGIKKAAAIAIPDPYKIQVVGLYVVKEEGRDEKALKDLIIARCKEELIAYAHPVEIEFRSELPLTLVGKVDVVKLEMEAAERRKGRTDLQ